MNTDSKPSSSEKLPISTTSLASLKRPRDAADSSASTAGASQDHRKNRQVIREDSQPLRVFACPFYKFDPVRYSENDVPCSTIRLTSISRVKQHLYRVHWTLPMSKASECLNHTFIVQQDSCASNIRSFDFPQSHDTTLLRSRASNQTRSYSPVSASSRSHGSKRVHDPSEDLTGDQLLELKIKRPRQEDLSAWTRIWTTLFPGREIPASPYFNPETARFYDACRKLDPAVGVALEDFLRTSVRHEGDGSKVLEDPRLTAVAAPPPYISTFDCLGQTHEQNSRSEHEESSLFQEQRLSEQTSRRPRVISSRDEPPLPILPKYKENAEHQEQRKSSKSSGKAKQPMSCVSIKGPKQDKCPYDCWTWSNSSIYEVQRHEEKQHADLYTKEQEILLKCMGKYRSAEERWLARWEIISGEENQGKIDPYYTPPEHTGQMSAIAFAKLGEVTAEATPASLEQVELYKTKREIIIDHFKRQRLRIEQARIDAVAEFPPLIQHVTRVVDQKADEADKKAVIDKSHALQALLVDFDQGIILDSEDIVVQYAQQNYFKGFSKHEILSEVSANYVGKPDSKFSAVAAGGDTTEAKSTAQGQLLSTATDYCRCIESHWGCVNCGKDIDFFDTVSD